jgi:hypothetical protein
MGDEGARQFPVLDVVLDLETHVVAGQVLLELSWLWRIKFHLKILKHCLDLLHLLDMDEWIDTHTDIYVCIDRDFD